MYFQHKSTNAKHLLEPRTNANNMNLIYDEAMHVLPIQPKWKFVGRLLYLSRAPEGRLSQRNYTKYFWFGRWFTFIQIARDFRHWASEKS